MATAASQRLSIRNFPNSLLTTADADYVQSGVTTNPTATDLTVLIWTRPLFAPNQPNGFSPNNSHYFYGQQAGGGTGRNWLFISNTLQSGNRNDYLSSNLGGVESLSTFRVQAGQLYLIGLTYDHTAHTLKLYANGANVATSTRTAESAAGNHILLQQQSLGGNKERQYFDQYLFFNRLLTDQEISDYYYLNIFDSTSLRCWYKVDEGSGTSLTDSSGNGLTGTISGTTWQTSNSFVPRTAI